MKIKELRKKRGLTQVQLATLLNVEQVTVSYWENGESMPTAKKLPELAQILQCSIDDLFENTGVENEKFNTAIKHIEKGKINSANVIQVIRIVVSRGAGTAEDLSRLVTQYWDFDGNFLAENDPVKQKKRTIAYSDNCFFPDDEN